MTLGECFRYIYRPAAQTREWTCNRQLRFIMILIAKMLLPETKEPKTRGRVEMSQDKNVVNKVFLMQLCGEQPKGESWLLMLPLC